MVINVSSLIYAFVGFMGSTGLKVDCELEVVITSLPGALTTLPCFE